MSKRITRRRFNFLSAAFGAASAASLAGFSGARAQGPVTLNFQANWLNNPEFIGYMVAIDNGYYTAEGLAVNYIPGGPNLIPEGSLLTGKADIALTNVLTTARAVVDRKAPLKIVGAQYQKSPSGAISLASSNINHPKDFVGKTIAVSTLGRNTISAFLKLHGIAEDQVKIVPYTFNPTPLINGEVDVIMDFVTKMPFIIEQRSGKKANFFLLYDHGLPFFIDLVVVTEETLKSRRGDVVKFLRASKKGWQENFVDTTKYADKYHDTWFKGAGTTIEVEKYSNRIQLDLMENPGGFFAMSEKDIQRNIEALATLGITAPPDMFDPSLVKEL